MRILHIHYDFSSSACTVLCMFTCTYIRTYVYAYLRSCICMYVHVCRGLLALWEYMRNELGVDTDKVWESIKDLAIKTIIR